MYNGYPSDSRAVMDFNSSCGSQISTTSMSCQYTPQISEESNSTQANTVNLQASLNSQSSIQELQNMQQNISDDEVYGESNGYPTLSNLFAVASQHNNNNNNIMEG